MMLNATQKEVAKFIIVMLVALLLRGVAIERESLWFDEAVSYLTAQLSSEQILSNVIMDPHPPLYYLTLRGWFSFWGNDPIIGRWLSVVFGLLVLVLVWQLAKLWLTSGWQRLTAVSLIAISPFHILYSHELRMYTLLMALAALVVFTYWQSRQRGGWWWWVFGLTAVLAMYTHLFTVFVLIAIGLHTLIEYRDREALWRTILVGFVVALAFVPWLIILSGESEVGIGSLRPLSRAGDADIIRDPLKPLLTLAFLMFGQSFTLWYTGLILFLTVGTAVILLLEIVKAWREGERAMLLPLLLVGCIVGGPVLVYYVRPFFLPERTMAAASPFLFILLAWGITRRHTPLPLLVSLSFMTMAFGAFQYLNGDLIKPPYQGVIEYVAEKTEVGDVIVHTSDGSYLPSLAYVTLPNHVLLAGDPDQRKPTAVFEALDGQMWSWQDVAEMGNGRLWLIVALEHSVEWQQAQANHLAACHPLLDEANFSGVYVYLYDFTLSSHNACLLNELQ